MKKKHDYSIDALQLFMSAILIVLGVVLKDKENFRQVAILFLALPGMTLLCGFFMNMISYRHIWTYPLLVMLVFDVQIALYYYSDRTPMSKYLIVVAFISIILTTLFHLLRVELFKGKK